MNKNWKHIGLVVIILILVNIVSNNLYKRFDLTEDQRYTLNEATIEIVNNIESPLIVNVFLKGEDFPSEFRRLQNETRQLLEEFTSENNNVVFNFINL